MTYRMTDAVHSQVCHAYDGRDFFWFLGFVLPESTWIVDY